MTDMNKEFERYDLNMIASNAKESYDKLKELNRAVVKKEDNLRLAIQDRILGVIDDKELERITREAKLANDASYDEKCKLRRLITRLRDIVDELNHVVFNAEYSCAEMDTSINIAMIFSDVKKMEENESSTCCETCKNYESNSYITGWCSACPGTVIKGMNANNTCAAYEKKEEEK